ncbi:hypothetical protein [Halosimplex salinum]|uniref:hypothetical protein n=1 Tax=Halosimplex salinum TaxID=1710538 RepID=UPI000F4741CB|nr:hypothetical protein [Halosimplex salinum]
MNVEIELPDTYATKLEEVEAVDPTVREQIEIEVLPEVLRLINEAHAQIDRREDGARPEAADVETDE